MKLKIGKRKLPHGYGGIQWTSCAPFIENTRAVLIHRPRYVTTHQISEKYKPHISIECWCGNSFSGSKKFTFLDAPPDGKLLCARCEEAATKRNMPSAESLVGRHVHLGRVVAERLCCEATGEATP
jgi:hypothetical protein